MRLRSLDGYEFSLPPSGGARENASSLHLKATALLNEHYPALTIMEEVPIKIRRNKTVYMDIMLPTLKIVLEVQGQQHYEYSRFLHGSREAFLRAQSLDKDKMEWCALNEFRLVELRYDEPYDQWCGRIRAAVNQALGRL